MTRQATALASRIHSLAQAIEEADKHLKSKDPSNAPMVLNRKQRLEGALRSIDQTLSNLGY